MKLLVDTMLGKLARYLRMAGHDAAYTLDRGVEDDDAILRLAHQENRVIITRDRSLAARADDGMLVESTGIEDQLRELKAVGIDFTLDEPTRCGRCNAPLTRIESASTPDYAPSVDEMPVWECVACGQCFWRGSHWDDVSTRLESL